MSDTDHSMSASAPETAPSASDTASTQTSAKSGRVQRTRMLVGVWIALVILALVLGAALYYQNQQYQAVRADLQQQQEENARLAQNAQSQAAQALDMARQQAEQIQQMSSALDATSSQLQDLDQALQLMTDSGSDLLLLNDIDHLVTIAQQQLALGGKVANAIISLEAAQAQLARANRPALAALQQSINGDLDRLRAVAMIDMSALSARLDELSRLVETAPLLIPDGLADTPATTLMTESAQTMSAPVFSSKGWQGVLDDTWQWTRGVASMLAQDLRGLFDVRRVDDSAALLMSPDQALRFREVLKQRVVTAQLALMMHQSRIWQSELTRVSQAIDQRYDMRAEPARQAQKLARELLDTPIETRLPTVANSLAAIAAAREVASADEAKNPAEHETLPEDTLGPLNEPAVPATPAQSPADTAS